MRDSDSFIQAYWAFREAVDFGGNGILPECDTLVWCLVAGLPEVPADDSGSPEASGAAIEQRVAILKAVFVEVNRDQTDEFLDQGLRIYDRAGKLARQLLQEEGPSGEAPPHIAEPRQEFSA